MSALERNPQVPAPTPHKVLGPGLRQARNTLEKDVSVGEKAYEEILHQMLLSDYDLVHLHCQDVHEGALPLDAVIQFFDVYALHKYDF